MKKRTAHRAGRRAGGAATKRNGLGGSSPNTKNVKDAGDLKSLGGRTSDARRSSKVHGPPVAGDVAKKPSRRDTAGVSRIRPPHPKARRPALQAGDASSSLAGAKPLRVAVLADLHVPHHDEKAVERALEEVAKFQPDEIVLMGDFLEVESFSTYPRSSPNLTIWADECRAGCKALDAIENAAPTANILYLEGNHENRAVKFVATDPRLLGSLSVPLALGLKERSIEWLPLPTCATVDAWQAPWGIIYLHGVYEGQQAAIQHARFVAREARLKTAVFAHGHTFCAATAEDGSIAYECPWLGNPGSDCHRYTKGKPRVWRHGMLEQLVYPDRVLTTFVPL